MLSLSLNVSRNRSRHQRCSLKKTVLKISQISQKTTCIGVTWRSATLLKVTPAQVVSCEFWEIFRNSFFYRITSGGCFRRYLSIESSDSLSKSNLIQSLHKWCYSNPIYTNCSICYDKVWKMRPLSLNCWESWVQFLLQLLQFRVCSLEFEKSVVTTSGLIEWGY